MITDYDTLKAEIASQMARSDVTADSASVSTAIGLAEKYISRKLRVVQMEDEQDISTVASQEYVDLPSGFLETRNLKYNDNPANITFIPLFMFSNLTIAQQAGRPEAYTVGNNSTGGVQTIKFAPTPDAIYTLTHTYLSEIPTLSDSQTTNWLITYDPELYLNLSLYFMYRRYRNPLAGEYLQLAEARISDMNKEDRSKKLGPSGTRIIVSNTV